MFCSAFVELLFCFPYTEVCSLLAAQDCIYRAAQFLFGHFDHSVNQFLYEGIVRFEMQRDVSLEKILLTVGSSLPTCGMAIFLHLFFLSSPVNALVLLPDFFADLTKAQFRYPQV